MLTGRGEHDQESGCIPFCRRLRDLIESEFGIDFELYTIQYLPCLFHRVCPLLVTARKAHDVSLFERRDSDNKKKARASSELEKYIIAISLAYLQARPKLWSLFQPLLPQQRAHILRELDLERICGRIVTETGVERHLRTLSEKRPLPIEDFWDRMQSPWKRACTLDSALQFSRCSRQEGSDAPV